MNNKYLNTLEYPQILENLAQYARFSASKTLALELSPSDDYETALNLQTETGEARKLFELKPDVGVGSAQDVRPLVGHARRAMVLQASDFLNLQRTLISARELKRTLMRLEDQFPHLADLAAQLQDISGLVNDISQTLDEAGRVKDSASPALAQIRRDIDISHGRLMEKMRRIVSSENVSKYLQDGIITQREGRYVVPLKTDFKGRIKGVIHGQSASGATTFIEPLSVVDLNNKWKELQLEEEKEVNRILAALSQKVALEGAGIETTVEMLAQLDLIFAKARYAESLNAVAPILINWPDPNKVERVSRINLIRARHPLLNPENVVPITVKLEPETSMLVITGPNTGGKTVSLKTIALLALMAQSGLHIPAQQGSSMLVFDAIFADIGDEQSLEQSLSTFSGHMTNIVSILDNCTPQSLVIFDELGAGTDPIEGAALARAILEHLLRQNVTTLVATHYAELKAYAYTTPGVANASMEFNLETLSPTYKLLLGVPGSSNAFAIAERLGLSSTILRSAQGEVGEEAKQVELMLAQIKADQDSAYMNNLRVEEELAEAEYYRQKAEERLAELNAESEKIIETARAQAQKELDDVQAELKELKRQARKAALRAGKVTDIETESAQETLDEVQTAMEKLQASLSAKAAPPKPETVISASSGRFKVGAKVNIPHLNATGIVTAVNKNEIEVQLGSFRTTLKRKQVTLTQAPPDEAPAPSGRSGSPSVDSPGFELDLRGQIAEDALHQLDSYLDQAYLAGLPFVRLIHGKGSGVLRRVVREALSNHPLVSSYQAGSEKEGGDGVTIAKLAH